MSTKKSALINQSKSLTGEGDTWEIEVSAGWKAGKSTRHPQFFDRAIFTLANLSLSPAEISQITALFGLPCV